MNSVASNDGRAAVATKLWELPASRATSAIAIESSRSDVMTLCTYNEWFADMALEKELDEQFVQMSASEKPCL
jgi:hypothetical protein